MCMPGCQYSYPVELRGEIRSAADGTYLGQVRVELSKGVAPIYSEPNGTFAFKFEDDWSAGATWQLSLSRDDFNAETVAMKMSHGPDTKGTTQIFVFVYMRPK